MTIAMSGEEVPANAIGVTDLQVGDMVIMHAFEYGDHLSTASCPMAGYVHVRWNNSARGHTELAELRVPGSEKGVTITDADRFEVVR